ncbi:MAG TPA: response regulator [Patescibacteria group bacterium]|nr:response regulator [Patescibacteria group bacterium]
MKHILIIEPDAVLSKIYKDYLSHHGFKIRIAKNVEQAIINADKNTPDLIILELQLIEHSGIEFLYEFRSYNEWQSVPIIINSQIPPREFKSSWQILNKDLGVNAYLYKPALNLSKLLNEVNKYILFEA